MTYEDLQALQAIVSRVANERRNLRSRVTLKLARVHRTLRKEGDLLEEVRLSLIEKHADRDDDGEMIQEPSPNGVRIRMKNQSAFDREWREVTTSSPEHELRFDPIPLAALGKEAHISAADLDYLEEFGIVSVDEEDIDQE